MALGDRELIRLGMEWGMIYEQQPQPVCPLCAIVLEKAEQTRMFHCTNCRFEITATYLDRFRGTMQRGRAILERNTPPVQVHRLDGITLKRIDKATRIIDLEQSDE